MVGERNKRTSQNRIAGQSKFRRPAGNSYLLAQYSLGAMLYRLGELDRAMECFETTRRAANSAADPKSTKIVLDFDIAGVKTGMSKYGEALALCQQVVLASDRLNMAVLKIHGRLLLGMICRHLGDMGRAVEVLEEAKGLVQNPDGMMALRISTDLVATYREMGEYDRALEVLRQELENHDGDEEEHSLRSAEYSLKMATILRMSGEYRAAQSCLRDARRTFAHCRQQISLMECDGELAWLRIAKGQYRKAIRIFQAIKRDHAALMSPEVSWHCSRGIGFAYFQLGDFTQSRNAYQEAVETLEDMRHEALFEESRISFLESKHEVFDKVIDCSLALRDYATALQDVERLKSRNLAVMLRGRDVMPKGASKEECDEYRRLRLEVRLCEYTLRQEQEKTGFGRSWEPFRLAKNRLQEFVVRLQKKDSSFDPDQVDPISADQIADLVEDTETAIIELYPMEDKTVAFVIRSDRKIDQSTVVIGRYNLESLSKDVEAIKDQDQLESVLQRLHDRIFVPLAPLLDGIKKIVFIPYGRFHLLPLHAMFTVIGGVRQYLMDDRLVTYAPSAKVLKYCIDRVRPHRQKAFVASADPTRKLPYPNIEAKALAELFETKECRRATRDQIIAQTSDAHIFHYAGHSDGNALCLHVEPLSSDEDFYDAGDIFVRQNLPETWLVTLSACETGNVRLGRADEYIGLPSAFLYSGTATVICSLWSVSDISTFFLMMKMYRLIEKGLGKAEALRKAQRWLKNPKKLEEHLQELEHVPPPLCPRAEKVVRDGLSHPYYWAGFICTGAP